jgi:hypothetical protein
MIFNFLIIFLIQKVIQLLDGRDAVLFDGFKRGFDLSFPIVELTCVHASYFDSTPPEKFEPFYWGFYFENGDLTKLRTREAARNAGKFENPRYGWACKGLNLGPRHYVPRNEPTVLLPGSACPVLKILVWATKGSNLRPRHYQ